MSEEKVMLVLDDFEQRVVLKGLTDLRNRCIENDTPTEDVNDVILKVIDAPPVKERKADRGAR